MVTNTACPSPWTLVPREGGRRPRPPAPPSAWLCGARPGAPASWGVNVRHRHLPTSGGHSCVQPGLLPAASVASFQAPDPPGGH